MRISKVAAVLFSASFLWASPAFADPAIGSGASPSTTTTIVSPTPLNIVGQGNGRSVASVNAATTTVTLLNSNTKRGYFTVYNNSNTNMYLSFQTNASTTLFTRRIVPGDFFETHTFVWTGTITAVWDGTPTGSAMVTEVSTP